jgi:hypothetical protein
MTESSPGDRRRDTQRVEAAFRSAKAEERRADAEERIAAALERIVTLLPKEKKSSWQTYP